MFFRLDPNIDEKEDLLCDEIERLSQIYRASGQIGDLIRLRDARVLSGGQMAGMAIRSVLEKPFPVQGAREERHEAELPELDMGHLTPEQLHAAVDEQGAALVRNVLSARQTLHLRTLFDLATSSGLELQELEAEDVPDIRHTDAKETYCRVDNRKSFLDKTLGAPLADGNAVEVFMSPRMSFDVCDMLDAVGFRGLLQSVMQDSVRFAFEQTVIRRIKPGAALPPWSMPDKTRPERLVLWVPLWDCGQGTPRPGIEITLRDLPGAQDISNLNVARPFIGAGDAIVVQNKDIASVSYGPQFTHDVVALEAMFLTRATSQRDDYPVFW